MDPSGRLDQRKILGPFDETFMTGSARSARQSIALVGCFTVQVLLKPWEATHRDSSNSHESTSGLPVSRGTHHSRPKLRRY